MSKNPLQTSITREVIYDTSKGNSLIYMLITPTKVYIGAYAFFSYAKPGDILVNHKGGWYSLVLSKNIPKLHEERLLGGANILVWKPQKRPLPKLAAAFKAIYMNKL